MNIYDLKPNPNNPRTISEKEFERLKDKIRSFPKMLELRPIVYNSDMVVLGGNQRLHALTDLKNEGFEVKDEYFKSASELTEEEQRQFVILDNISDGKWDTDVLANKWSDLPLPNWGIDTGGWEEDQKEMKEQVYDVCPTCGHKKLRKE